MDSANSFLEMDQEFESTALPSTETRVCTQLDMAVEDLARNIFMVTETRDRVLKAIAGVWPESMLYPSLRNCIGYFKITNPVSKVDFMRAYGKIVSTPHVKRKIPTAHLTSANITYKSFPLEIRHPEVVSYVFAIIRAITGNQIINTTTPTPAELKTLDKRHAWLKLKTRKIIVPPGPSQRHFLRLLDRLFYFYKPKNNPDETAPANETDTFVSKKMTSIALENLFRDLELQMEYSAGPTLEDNDDEDNNEYATPAERRAAKKKRQKKVAPKSSVDNTTFALLMHVTVILVNPTFGKKGVHDITRERNRVQEYINSKYSGPGMTIGTVVHSINVVGEIRIPCMTNLDVEKFQANLIANVIKNKNIARAGKEIMKVGQRKAMNKFPSLQVNVCNLYGKKSADVTLQIYESGYVSITGPKTRSSLYEYYPGIMMIMYLASLDREQLTEFMEQSMNDAEKHRLITYMFDKADTEIKLDEEYRKEKICGAGSIKKTPEKSLGRKHRGTEDEKKHTSFRKSDLANPKKKFEARYNAKFSTNFDVLASEDCRTTEWSSEVLNIFNFYEFTDTAGFCNWLNLSTSLSVKNLL